METICSLRIKKSKVFFGPGTCELLERIDQTSSIRKATEEMNLSYTKALRMLKDMRTELGFEVVASEKGGSNRGKTVLTKEGRQILESYQTINAKVGAYAQQIFEENFPF